MALEVRDNTTQQRRNQVKAMRNIIGLGAKSATGDLANRCVGPGLRLHPNHLPVRLSHMWAS